ncbi:MAG: hypothetical protein AAB965_01570, partial [Patescibacteria group bacterium]
MCNKLCSRKKADKTNSAEAGKENGMKKRTARKVTVKKGVSKRKVSKTRKVEKVLEVTPVVSNETPVVKEVVFNPDFELAVAPIETGTGVDVVAFTSRWDYGSDGSRVGLLKKMKEEFERAKAEFSVLVGGVVSKRGCQNSARRIQDMQKKVSAKLKLDLEQLVAEFRVLEDGEDEKALLAKRVEIDDKKDAIKAAKPQTIGQILAGMVEGLAQQINKDLPALFCPDGTRMKIYIVTSKAFDGDIGRDVVKRLLEIRKDENDIRYLSSRYEEDTTFKVPLKKSGGTFAVVVPTKAVWRSAYYSTNADR